jgi:hypothetical protein
MPHHEVVLKDNEAVLVTAVAHSAAGNPAGRVAPDAPPRWESSDVSVATVVPRPEYPLMATIAASGKLGRCRVTMTAVVGGREAVVPVEVRVVPGGPALFDLDVDKPFVPNG